MMLLFAAACTLTPADRRNDNEGSDGDSVQTGPVNDPETAAQGVNRNAVALEKTASMQFDKQGGEELFRVALLGDSVLTGTIAFTITNDKGELVYSDEFPANMLAATYDETIDTPQEQEALIRERLNDFFDPKRFKHPAIKGNQPPHDSFFLEKDTYDNLMETNAPGFIYVIGKENAKHIAWSPVEQKVIMYFNCC